MRRVIAVAAPWLALASLFAGCGPSSTYYRDSGGLIREPKPEDPRLPYGVQQGEYYRDHNLWPHAIRGPMNFLGKYRFSHKWFVVRGACNYGGVGDKPGPESAGRGRGFVPRSYSDHGLYGDVFKRGGKLFQHYKSTHDGTLKELELPARAYPPDSVYRTAYYRPICELDADAWMGGYSSYATRGQLYIKDVSFEQLETTGQLGVCSKNPDPERYKAEIIAFSRGENRWKGCRYEFRRNKADINIYYEWWMTPIGNTGYHLQVVMDLSRPVSQTSDWLDERRRAFLEVLDSVRIEALPASR